MGGGGSVRSMEFRDANNNGIDDRDEQGIMPPAAPNQAALPPAPTRRSVQAGSIPGMRQTSRNNYSYSPFKAAPNAPMIPEAPGEFSEQPTVGAEAAPADYESVQGFADQAYEQARTRIDPMQEQAGRRMEQDLINKGIDPSSDQGKAMLTQQNQNFSDQDNAATFGALQFGQGIQQQMFGQDFQNVQHAGNMQLGNRAADNTRYGIDKQYSLGMGNLDVNRQGQDFGQMMGLEGNQFRNRAYNDSRSDYQDALTMSLMGMTPVPGYGGYDPSGLAGTQINNSSGGGFF